MTNDTDDFEHELGHEPDGSPKTGMRANLVNAWQSQPLVKLLVLMVIVCAVVGVTFSLLSGGASERKNTTAVGTPPALHEPPGGAASPFVKQQTMMASEQREKDAMANGNSSLPTPIGNEVAHDDALKELKAQIESLSHEVNKPKPAPTPPTQPIQQVQPEQFDDSLARAMQKQLIELSGSWSAHGIKQVTGVEPATPAPPAPNGSPTSGQPIAAANQPYLPPTPPKILVPAGTVSYAKLLTEANSDVPGPILAEIVTGPLTGARAVGTFEVANNYTDYLILKFTLAELKGKEYIINTVALDPNTSLAGMATDVDERYFERVVLPAAAAFLQGFGSALNNTGSTVTTNGTTTIVSQGQNGIKQGVYSGASQAANTAGQFFQNQANVTKPLIVVAAGTPMGLLFVTSLKDIQPGAYPYGYPGQGGYPYGYAGAGYPGTGYPGAGYPGAGFPGFGGTNPVAFPNTSFGNNTGAFGLPASPSYNTANANPTSPNPYNTSSNPYPGGQTGGQLSAPNYINLTGGNGYVPH